MAISFGAPIRTQTPSGTSHTIDIGTPSAGDAILIVGVLNRFTLGPNVLSGYVDVVSETAGSGADCFVALKIAGASEPNPVLTTGSATAGDFHVVHVSGVDASTPIAQTELETDQPSGTSVTTATLASVGTGEAVVAIAVVLDDRRTLSVDGALTEVAAPNNGDNAQGAWGYEVFPSGGSSVSYTFGFGGITEQGGSFIFSLNPAGGAGVTVSPAGVTVTPSLSQPAVSTGEVVSTTNVLQPPADVDFWGTVAGYPPADPAESVFDDSTLTVVDGDQYAVRIDSGLLGATLAADGVLEADTPGSLTRWILDASGTGVDGEWYGPGTVNITFGTVTVSPAPLLATPALSEPSIFAGVTVTPSALVVTPALSQPGLGVAFTVSPAALSAQPVLAQGVVSIAPEVVVAPASLVLTPTLSSPVIDAGLVILPASIIVRPALSIFELSGDALVGGLARLRESVRDYLARRDLTNTQIDTFLAISSRRIFRRLRIAENERVEEIATTGATLELPDDYLAAKSLTCDGVPLRRVTDLRILEWSARGHRGLPAMFSRISDRILIYPAPDAEKTLTLTYWADLSDMADPLDGLLLDLCPELWIHGALVEASMFLRKVKPAMEWDGLFERALDELNFAADEEERSGSVTRVRAGID